MPKTKALLFLLKCTGYIGWRIVRGKRWNMLIADLEEADGVRKRYIYRISGGKYTLDVS